MSEDLITLRDALILLRKPHTKEDVRALRRKLQRRESKKGVRILTPSPYRISMSQLREHAPELFVDVESILERRMIKRVSRALQDIKAGD